MKRIYFMLSLMFLLLPVVSCNRSTSTQETTDCHQKAPSWIKNASIYEVNIRQYTPEGTFDAFATHLPRLRELGVDILWLMPIFPIGEVERKGTLGSYYSVKDYVGVNPEFGTMEEFKGLVKQIHDAGMYVVLDWVANHTARDHKWITDHPEWYTRDSLGNILPPVADWSDVADLNYDQQGLWEEMRKALSFWVREADVDGFRCDVAGMIPFAFWDSVRVDLNRIKPVFMLAEWEDPALLVNAFDMDYNWELLHVMNGIARGEKSVRELDSTINKTIRRYQTDDIRMNFVTNHDENSWNGTAIERLGDGLKAFTLLTFTLPGMPLIYSGQEAGLNKALSFFEKDEIEWKDDPMSGFYKQLLALKKRNPALWNGACGGTFRRIPTSADDKVIAFLREKEEDKVFVVINLSPDEQKFSFSEKCYCDKYTDLFTGQTFEIADEISMILAPWSYSVCEKSHND
jgi:glycosidase